MKEVYLVVATLDLSDGSGFAQFTQWAVDALAAVPPEYADRATLSIKVLDDESIFPEIELSCYYMRLETPEEAAEREAKERASREAQDREEYLQYVALKKRFEGA